MIVSRSELFSLLLRFAAADAYMLINPRAYVRVMNGARVAFYRLCRSDVSVIIITTIMQNMDAN